MEQIEEIHFRKEYKSKRYFKDFEEDYETVSEKEVLRTRADIQGGQWKDLLWKVVCN